MQASTDLPCVSVSPLVCLFFVQHMLAGCSSCCSWTPPQSLMQTLPPGCSPCSTWQQMQQRRRQQQLLPVPPLSATAPFEQTQQQQVEVEVVVACWGLLRVLLIWRLLMQP